jgi:hypothetical protein
MTARHAKEILLLYDITRYRLRLLAGLREKRRCDFRIVHPLSQQDPCETEHTRQNFIAPENSYTSSAEADCHRSRANAVQDGANFHERMTGACHEHYGWAWRRVGQWRCLRQVAELFSIQCKMTGIQRDLNLDRCRKSVIRMEFNFCDGA